MGLLKNFGTFCLFVCFAFCCKILDFGGGAGRGRAPLEDYCCIQFKVDINLFTHFSVVKGILINETFLRTL